MTLVIALVLTVQTLCIVLVDISNNKIKNRKHTYKISRLKRLKMLVYKATSPQ